MIPPVAVSTTMFATISRSRGPTSARQEIIRITGSVPCRHFLLKPPLIVHDAETPVEAGLIGAAEHDGERDRLAVRAGARRQR
jgi:hypothetical protein